MITNFVYLKDFQYHGYLFPVWAQVIGWMTAIVPLVLVPIAAIYTFRTDLRTNPFTAETVFQVRIVVFLSSCVYIPTN